MLNTSSKRGVLLSSIFFVFIVVIFSVAGCDSGGAGIGDSGDSGGGGGGASLGIPTFSGDVPSGEVPTFGDDGSVVTDTECLPSSDLVQVQVNPGVGGSTRRTTGVFSAASAPCGLIGVSIAVVNTNAFQVVSQALAADIFTIELISPSNASVVSVLDNPPRTTAVRIDDNVNSLPYPTLGADAPVENGIYNQSLFFFNNNSSVPLQGTVIAKNDRDFDSGTLRVNVFLVGQNAVDSRTDIETAIDNWRIVYGVSGVRIALSVRIFEISDGEPLLPAPGDGADFYFEQSSRGDVQPFAVNMFVVDDIEDAEGSLFGVAPSIPGAGIPTRESGVTISLLSVQGDDGALSPAEVRLLTQVMAHEAGHYLGLYHPVQGVVVGPGQVVFVPGLDDPLDDTPTCTDMSQCRLNGAASNLMFPFPDSTVVQLTLTEDQGEVLNRQAIVD